ncbi:hypothetical protein [Microbacterium xylanilyticum]
MIASAAAALEQFVASATSAAPPLTDAQAERIAAILRHSTPAAVS